MKTRRGMQFGEAFKVPALGGAALAKREGLAKR
jgi:hypothetical protein